jgi:hypothetical protein
MATNMVAGQKMGGRNPDGMKIRQAGINQNIAKVTPANNIGQPTSARVETGSTRMCIGKPELLTPKSAGPNVNLLSTNAAAIDTITIDPPQQYGAAPGNNCTISASPSINAAMPPIVQRSWSQSE